MQITKTFTVRATPDAAWAFLTDPERVASCLPGAAITSKTDERTYSGTITVKVGPVSTSYKGTVRFERLDAGARAAEIVASGQDIRGKGGAQMHMTSKLVERAPGETEVTVVSDVNVTGILAQMGRGMIQDVSDQLFQKFTGAMAAALASAGSDSIAPADAAPGSSAPIQVVSLGARAMRQAAGRAARRPVAWAVVLVLVLAVWWLVRR